MNVGLLLRTVKYLKPIQVFNRIWRKLYAVGCAKASPAAVVAGGLPEFEFLNQTATPANWNDSTLPKLWLYNLHYFEKYCNAELIERWIAENPRGFGNGWEPYTISLRVVSWIKWLNAHPENPQFSARVTASIVEQIEYLLPRLEYHLLANHLLANAKALVFAGIGCQRDDWYAKGRAIYRRELPEQVLDDGVHFELSAMYHSIILNDVLDCLALIKSVGKVQDIEFFANYARKMLTALDFLTGPDGTICKFNDAAEGIAPTPAALHQAAEACGIEAAAKTEATNENSGSKRVSGIYRLENRRDCLMVKMGDIGPDYQPGHAHADVFSFELWRDGRKLVTDTGTDRYVIDAERRRQRSTSAHNSVVIDGKDSSEVWAGHRVGRRSRCRVLETAANRIVGVAEYNGVVHRRTLELDERGVRGRDEIEGRGEHEIELRFHGLAELPVKLEADIFVRTVETAMICEEFGKQRAGVCTVFRARVALPVVVNWQI